MTGSALPSHPISLPILSLSLSYLSLCSSESNRAMIRRHTGEQAAFVARVRLSHDLLTPIEGYRGAVRGQQIMAPSIGVSWSWLTGNLV
jgi:hypothetical protein